MSWFVLGLSRDIFIQISIDEGVELDPFLQRGTINMGCYLKVIQKLRFSCIHGVMIDH